ncbi:MAG TPA: hypothetical protein VIY48_16430 [Candidatus Paceibacterota bacterium]
MEPSPDNVTHLPDNVTRLKRLAAKWRRQVTNAELVEILDDYLGDSECPRCRELRLANRARQKKYREARRA